MSAHPLTSFALRQHGLVTRSQAAGAGCSDQVLQRLCRDGTLCRIERGVYRFTSVPRSFEQQVLAACLAHPGTVACRLTAVRLYGFEVEAGDAFELLCDVPRRSPRGRGHVLHCSRSLPDADRVVRRGIPVTAPTRTLRDAAPLLSAGLLDRFLGYLLATREVTALQLKEVVAGGPPALRAAIERAGVVVAPDSVLEHRALLLLRAAGLPEPAGQFPIHAGGRLAAVVDFAWPDERVVLEIDGYRWHADPGSFAGDRRRDNLLRELGWTVYRTTSADLAQGGAALLRQLGAALSGRRPADSRF